MCLGGGVGMAKYEESKIEAEVPTIYQKEPGRCVQRPPPQIT